MDVNGGGICESCVAEIDFSFEVTHSLQEYESILAMRVVELECKHIMFETDSNEKVVDLALAAYYDNIQWGYHRLATVDSENAIIDEMVKVGLLRPMRVVMTDRQVWADNTHTAISYVRRYGREVTVGDVPCYICDLTKQPTVLAGRINYLGGDATHQFKAVKNSIKLRLLEENGGRPPDARWSIADLMEQL